MYRSQAPRLTGTRRTAVLLTLALAAACGDGVTNGGPRNPGGGTPPDTTPVVASVEITPGTLQLPVESSRALSATARTRTGAVITGRLVTWSSSDSSVVRVDINGNATALKVGTAIITAALDGHQGQSIIEVTPPPAPPAVAFVAVQGNADGLEPGESRQLSAQLRAASGTILYRPVTWSSSDSAVVRVFPDGRILGVGGGTATITATSEGKSGTLTVVIPQWLQFDLQSANAHALPVELEMSADTTQRTEYSMVVTEYRLRLTWGRLWLSTVDTRYRQRYDVQLWKRTVTHFQGNTITGEEELVETRAIRDEGRGEMWDVLTGELIYESTTFAGHTFRAHRTVSPGRWTSQRLPGEGGAIYELSFKK